MRAIRLLLPRTAFASVALCLGACHPSAPAPPQIRIAGAQGLQHVAADVRPSRTVIKVESPGGIGSADVILTKGAWTAEVVLQLSLRGLEELRFAFDDTTVVVSVASSGTNEVRESLSTEAGASRRQPLSPDSPYWMNVAVPTAATIGSPVPDAGGHFEVKLPVSFLRGTHRDFVDRFLSVTTSSR